MSGGEFAAVALAIAGIVVTAGFAFVNFEHRSGAKVAFWLGAIPFGGAFAVWSASSGQPFWLRALVNGVMGAIAAIGASELSRSVSSRGALPVPEQIVRQSENNMPEKKEPPPIKIDGSNNVINYGTLGNVSQGGNKPQEPQPPRDPDGLYQFGEKVAQIELPVVDRPSGKVHFGLIRGTTFNKNVEFEYRTYRLKLVGWHAEGNMSLLGGPRTWSWTNATCDIVGITSP